MRCQTRREQAPYRSVGLMYDQGTAYRMVTLCLYWWDVEVTW